MTNEALEIITKLSTYLSENPQIRFGQALVNLNIIEMEYQSRNIHTSIIDPFFDSDKQILERINKDLIK